MAYTSKLQALDAICRSHGGSGGHVRTIRALNEWCVLLGGAGGHVRNVRALNEICGLLGAEAGHFLEIRALNAIATHLGGAGGHRVSLAALTEIAARRDGAFPADLIAGYIDGREDVDLHGPRDMPVWGDGLAQAVPEPGEREARIRRAVEMLVAYLETIQKH